MFYLFNYLKTFYGRTCYDILSVLYYKSCTIHHAVVRKSKKFNINAWWRTVGENVVFSKAEVHRRTSVPPVRDQMLSGAVPWRWKKVVVIEILSQRWMVLLQVMALVGSTDGHWTNPQSSRKRLPRSSVAEAPLYSCFCIAGGSCSVGSNANDDPRWMSYRKRSRVP